MRSTVLPSLVLVVAACALLSGKPRAAYAGDSTPAVEQLGDVQVVSPSEGGGKARGLGDLIGRLHPALVHFPIAGLVALAVVDLIGVGLRRESWRRAGMVVLIATTVALLPTVATGLLRATHMAADAGEQSLIVKHRTLNLTVTGLVIAALVLRAARRKPLLGAYRIAYLTLVYVATALVLVAADFGGRLVYGPDYLPF